MKSSISSACVLLLCVLMIGTAACTEPSSSVRPAAVAGSWYPDDPDQLARYIDGLLAKAEVSETPSKPRAIIAPHAGYRYSGATAAKVMAMLRSHSYRRVVVLGPAHRSGFDGLSVLDVAAYETPLGKIALDREAIAHLRNAKNVVSEPQAHRSEHSIEMELPMLQRAIKGDWRLIPILVGRMSEADFAAAAELIRPLLDDETLLVISSDFTHYGPGYGYTPFPFNAETAANIKQLDDGAFKLLQQGDAKGFLDYMDRTGITVCGFGPLTILAHLMGPNELKLIAYDTSGNLVKDYHTSVSYLAAVLVAQTPLATVEQPKAIPQEIAEQDLKTLHELARLGVLSGVTPQAYRAESRDALIQRLPLGLREKAGAFVTLKRDGQLRGCIGYIEPIHELPKAIFQNGVNAALHDRRFQPVAPEELAGLDLEVSVLTKPHTIASIQQFQLGRHGIILNLQGRRAVYLPEVAVEQGWSKEETLSHLAQKAGLPAMAWKDPQARLEVFESRIYEAPFEASVAH